MNGKLCNFSAQGQWPIKLYHLILDDIGLSSFCTGCYQYLLSVFTDVPLFHVKTDHRS